MADRAFAPWVAPIAAKHRESRRQIVEIARTIPAEAWSRPSPCEGWPYKDLLAHLASSDGSDFHIVLRSVIARERVDASLLTGADARNARNVSERSGRTVEELIAELEAGGEETQDLLSRLTAADEDLRQDDIPMSLGEGLRRDPGGHDQEHLAQIRAALEG